MPPEDDDADDVTEDDDERVVVPADPKPRDSAQIVRDATFDLCLLAICSDDDDDGASG